MDALKESFRVKTVLKSPRTKTVAILAFAVLFVFLTLMYTYRMETDRFLIDMQGRQLTELSNELHGRIFDEVNSERPNVAALEKDIRFIGRSSDAFVWLVKPDGEIEYSTAFPAGVSERLEKRPDGQMALPDVFVGVDLPADGLLISGGNYLGLFQDDGHIWLSYVRPIHNLSNQVIYILQLHKPFDRRNERGWIFFNGMGFSLIISFALTFIFIMIASYNLNKPLKTLAAAAERVARGDLSARVPEPSYTDTDEGMLWVRDEISVLNHTFNDMVEQLEHLNTDRRDLMACISHDLRTPLTSIGGFIGGMLDGTIPPDKYSRYLRIVQNETRRLAGMVEQIHEMVTLESDGIHYEIQPLNIYELISSAVTGLETQLLSKHITVQTTFSEDMQSELMVLGDKVQLQRVLVNLITNAIKFTPDGGVIAISTSHAKHSEYITVTVEDSGVGLEKQDIGNVFNRFFKEDRSRGGNTGSGLGLYIVKNILSAHGQRIWAGNSKMGGAKFTFTLQIA